MLVRPATNLRLEYRWYQLPICGVFRVIGILFLAVREDGAENPGSVYQLFSSSERANRPFQTNFAIEVISRTHDAITLHRRSNSSISVVTTGERRVLRSIGAPGLFRIFAPQSLETP